MVETKHPVLYPSSLSEVEITMHNVQIRGSIPPKFDTVHSYGHFCSYF
jgi:hypothetical protein